MQACCYCQISKLPCHELSKRAKLLNIIVTAFINLYFLTFLLNLLIYLKDLIFICWERLLNFGTFRTNQRNELLLHVLFLCAVGCDSGFGHSLALNLDKQGFTVFAGCLSIDREGARGLQESSKNIHVVQLDVTDDWQVRKAVQTVKENLNGKGEIGWLIDWMMFWVISAVFRQKGEQVPVCLCKDCTKTRRSPERWQIRAYVLSFSATLHFIGERFYV